SLVCVSLPFCIVPAPFLSRPTIPFLCTSLLLIPRPPPRSTLFPYTTLFRSCWPWRPWPCGCTRSTTRTDRPGRGHGCGRHGRRRSEEHTSELQSRFDLVCRLLLEKKKKIDKERNTQGKT